MALPSNADLPNYPFPAVARTFDFEFLRMMMQALGSHAAMEGIAGASTDLAVSITSGLQLSAAAGRAFVKGDDRSTQGSYFCYVPAAQSVTLDAHHATLPRIDRVVLRVYDADVSGAQTKWAVEKVTGTATAGATLSNLSGAASVPNGALLLANVLVPATSGAVTLQDRRYGVPVAGRELFGGVGSVLTLDSAGAGDKSSVTVIGDGTTLVKLEAQAHSKLTNGAAGTNVYTEFRDGASGTGTSYAAEGSHVPAANYRVPCSLQARVAAFSGSKTFYWHLNNSAGVPTMIAAATAPTMFRATWAA